jgi:oligopeptidase B
VIDKTRDLKYLILQIEAKDTSEVRYLRADRPADNFAVFLPREKGHRYYLDHREGLVLHPDQQERPQFRRDDRAG